MLINLDRKIHSLAKAKFFELVDIIKKDIDNGDRAEGRSSGMSQAFKEVPENRVSGQRTDCTMTSTDKQLIPFCPVTKSV